MDSARGCIVKWCCLSIDFGAFIIISYFEATHRFIAKAIRVAMIQSANLRRRTNSPCEKLWETIVEMDGKRSCRQCFDFLVECDCVSLMSHRLTCTICRRNEDPFLFRFASKSVCSSEICCQPKIAYTAVGILTGSWILIDYIWCQYSWFMQKKNWATKRFAVISNERIFVC